MNNQQKTEVIGNQFDDCGLHKIHFYATEEQLKQRQLISSIAFDQIVEEGLIDHETINEIYSYINHKIIQYKYIGNASSKDECSQELCNYLKFKLTIYNKYYGNQCKSKAINQNQMNIFQTQKLLHFFIQMGHVKRNIKKLAKKIFGDHNRKLKIDIFLLIQNIQNLLRQIKNAAFPHLLFPNSLNSLEIFSATHHFNQFEKDMIKKQSALVSQFKLYEEDAMKNSILEIKDWIQSLEYQLKIKEKDIQNTIKESKLMMDQIFMVETSIVINKLKILKIKHQAVAFLNQHNHKKIQLNLQFLIKIVNQDPLKKYSTDDILDIVSGQRQAWLHLQQLFNYHKNLIEVVQRLIQANKNIESFQGLLIDIIFLLEKWIIIIKYQKNQLLLFENYIAILRIYKVIDPSFISVRQDNIFPHIMNYLQQMISHLAHYHRQLIQKIHVFDQQLTYKIFTSNKIVSTVLSFQDDFVILIKQISPLMEVMVVLEEIKSKKSQKITLISNVLSKIVYLSLMRIDSMSLITKSKIIMDSIIDNIELILQSQYSDFFEQFKPYLQQIKYILMLVDIIRSKKSKQNMGKFQQEQYQRLKQIAAYFSKERPECPIYELKAKILLFITLFRMGYHVPSLKMGDKAINLRNRIVNLYSKLYGNTSGELIKLQKLNSLMVVSGSKKQDYIVYSPSKPDVKDNENAEEEIYLSASFKLTTKINYFISNCMTNSQINCKKYLLNLLNVLEHQLFVIQRQNSKQTQRILSNHYVESVKLSMDKEDMNGELINLSSLLQIQRFCFLERYDIAWKLLLKQKKENQNIDQFLSQLSIPKHQSNEIFQFARIHIMLQRMNYIFSNQNKQQSILQITQILNNNSIYPVSKKAVQFLFNSVYDEKRLKQLQQFYQTRLKNQSQNQEDFKPIKNRFDSQFIKIAKKDLQNKSIIVIQIDEVYKAKFPQLKQELKKYFLLNQIGLYKVSNVKEKRSLLIELQSNNYNEFNIKNIKKSFIQQQQFKQNLAQKLTKNLIINILQANQYFYNRKKSSSILNNEQINIDYENYSYSINPFCILIDKILNNNSKYKENSQFQINFECSKIIETKIFPYLSQFSDHFKSSYYYLLETLRTFNEHKFEKFQFTKLLSHPFFMNLEQKQVFIIYFDNKMSQMCDKFHIKERQLKKQKNIPQLEKNIMNRMKDSIYQNYSYNFIIGGILQLQIIELKICSQDRTNKLDWISKHSKCLFSYEFPKRQNGQIKEYAYSLNIFLKYLRGALAHKIANNSSIILSILQQYPKLLNFLHYHKSLLQMKYDQVMNTKNEWLKSYFSITHNELTFLTKYIYQPDKYNFKYGGDIKECLLMLKLYSSEYQTQVRNYFKNKFYKCDKCKIMIKKIQITDNIFDLFFFLKNNEKQDFAKILSAQHSFRQCFISQYFRQHRALKIFGGLLKKTEAKQFIIINWWFYFESMFPCLIMHLNRIRFLFLLQ